MSCAPSISIKTVRRNIRQILAQLTSKEPITAVAWADEFFKLSPESSYTSGDWETDPFQIAILNAMGCDDVHEIYLYKGARIGYTKMLLAAMFYLIEHKRRNVGFWREDDKAIEKFVATELDHALRDCKKLHPIFPSVGKKGPGNTVNLKTFIGATLRCQGGQSAGNYRGDSVDVAIGDEINAFVTNLQGKSGKEGSPWPLMFKRTNGSAWPKKILGTTPTKTGESHIERLSKKANHHLRFHLPCPHCGEEQHLEWTSREASYGFKWDNRDPDTARYRCRSCGDDFTHSDYLELARQGIWKDPDTGVWTRNGLDYFDHRNQPIRARRICFYVPGYLSTRDPWRNMVQRWYDDKDDPLTRQAFFNTDLGVDYTPATGEKLDHSLLIDRRERWMAQVPAGGLYLTSFTDVQTSSRLETTTVAWGEEEEYWVLDHVIHPGDPSQQEVWNNLEKYLRQPWMHESGVELRISRMGVDTGGHNWDEVIDFASRFPPHQVIPCKGSSVYGDPIANYHKTTKGKNIGTWLCHIGTDSGKETMFSRYKQPRQGTGPQPRYMHLPIADWCNEKWAKQATNAIKVLVDNGRKLQFVFKMRSSTEGDEALDCLVGNLAMIRLSKQMFALDLKTLAQSMQQLIKGKAQRTNKPRRSRAGRVTGGV